MSTPEDRRALVVETYFAGDKHHQDGPYTIFITDGKISKIESGDLFAPDREARVPSGYEAPEAVLRAAFALPGLVESHCHLFLNGSELDFQKRKDYLKQPLEVMIERGRESLRETLAAGVTLVRDGGDIHGVNHFLRAEGASATELRPDVLSAGNAIRKVKRYGSFMAREVDSLESITAMIHELAPEADQLKILMTGLIDFEQGVVKGKPQFDLDDAKHIVALAKELGLHTFTHCHGVEGLTIATEAGFDSIEHGFFMTEEILRVMVEKSISWVPTVSPVHYVWAHPEVGNWSDDTLAKLRAILDNHDQHIELAARLGVPVVAGSDAGSYGVAHGKALLDEIVFQVKAGMPVDESLRSATSRPRTRWGQPSADIQTGNAANLVLLDASPFVDIENIHKTAWVLKDGQCLRAGRGRVESSTV